MEESLEAQVQKMKKSVQKSIRNNDPFLARPNSILFNSLIDCESCIYLGDVFTIRVGFVSMCEGEEITSYRPVAILSPSTVEEGHVVNPIQKPLMRETGEIFSCSFATEGLPEGRYVVVVKYDENRTGGKYHPIDIYKRSTIGTFLSSFFGIEDLRKMRLAHIGDSNSTDEFTWDGLLLMRDEDIKHEILALVPATEQEQFKGKLDEAFERAIQYWENQLEAMFSDNAKKFLMNMKKPQKIL